VRIGTPDPSLTPNAGLAAVTELVEHLNVTATLDAGIGPLKQRNRGISGAELLVSMACCHVTGGDHLVSLDRLRADTAGQELVSVPTPASTTAAGVAARFTPQHLAGIETGLAVLHQRVLAGVGQVRRSSLLREVTLDLDATDVEVYGRCKRGCGYTYQGQRAYRPDIAFWAELGLITSSLWWWHRRPEGDRRDRRRAPVGVANAPFGMGLPEHRHRRRRRGRRSRLRRCARCCCHRRLEPQLRRHVHGANGSSRWRGGATPTGTAGCLEHRTCSRRTPGALRHSCRRRRCWRRAEFRHRGYRFCWHDSGVMGALLRSGLQEQRRLRRQP
jgi:hypothetical protein